MEESVIRERIRQLLSIGETSDIGPANELVQGTLSLLAAVHGPESQQVTTFLASVDSFRKNMRWNLVSRPCIGALRNLEGELEAGLTESIRKQMTGDVLTDFIQLARAVLDKGGSGSKNVASVLAAAAYEDTIRRMGSAFAGVVGRDDLDDVIAALQTKGILVSPQLGIALSYLSFRNHALHADWEKIELEAVHSILGFVEQLLMKHFA